jgi:hypothetical protein
MRMPGNGEGLSRYSFAPYTAFHPVAGALPSSCYYFNSMEKVS